MSMMPECPECRQGKHPNCSGRAIDREDRFVTCSCANREHLSPSDYVEKHGVVRVGDRTTP